MNNVKCFIFPIGKLLSSYWEHTRVCQNRHILFFFVFLYDAFITSLYIAFFILFLPEAFLERHKSVKMVCIKSVRIRFMPSIPRLMSFLHIFLMLKAMAKKAKSIVTLSFPKWRKRRYAILYFVCPKTASGSMHRRPLCLTPSWEVSLSLAFRLYSLSL